MTLIVNKLSGVFGVFGLLSGANITALQLSMYFYSLLVFTVICVLTPEIRKRLPFATLSFAYIYLIDSLINIAYTVAFGIHWFAVLSSTYGSSDKGPAQLDTTQPPSAGNATVAIPTGVVDARDTVGVMQPESATSIFVISLCWAIRFYLLVIVFAHAREVVRKSATPQEAPFEGSNGGEGWKGKVGRALVSVGRGYFEGEGWMGYGKRRDTGERQRFRGVRLGSLEV